MQKYYKFHKYQKIEEAEQYINQMCSNNWILNTFFYQPNTNQYIALFETSNESALQYNNAPMKSQGEYEVNTSQQFYNQGFQQPNMNFKYNNQSMQQNNDGSFQIYTG